MPPKLSRMQHIALKVRDLEKSLEFYVGIMGFRVIEHVDQLDLSYVVAWKLSGIKLL